MTASVARESRAAVKLGAHRSGPATEPRGARLDVGYWAAILAPIAAHTTFSLALWYHAALSSTPQTTAGALFTAAKAIWLLPLPWALLNLIGLISYGPPHDPPSPGPPNAGREDALLIVAYVSRGQNQVALHRAATQTARVLEESSIRCVIEVVTDVRVRAEHRLTSGVFPVKYYVVPPTYCPPNGARYKARALQYLLERRTARQQYDPSRRFGNNVWVLHLDEESVLTTSAVLGLQEFFARHDLAHEAGAIGQGEILYNAYHYGEHPLITAIDSVRTGDDLGRFRLQFKCWRRPIFGMHGSFFAVPASVEARIGWDLGAAESVTEDACFALLAMERGIPFEWIDGVVKEQSPFTIADLVQQRRRWLSGLEHVASDSGFRRRTTICLRIFVMLWKLSWLGTLMLVVSIIASLSAEWAVVPCALLIPCAVVTGIAGSTYMVGALRNCRHSELSPWHRRRVLFATYVLWLLWLPAMIEGWAVLKALLWPVTGFHVVDKNPMERNQKHR